MVEIFIKKINVVVAVTIILDAWWELNDSVIRNCWIKSALVERRQMMIEDTAYVIDYLLDGMEEDNLIIKEACEIMNLQ